MTIQGELNYGLNQFLQPSMHSGLLGILGEDGNHYIHAESPFSGGLWISRIDDNDEFFEFIDQTKARNDLDSLGLSGVVVANWYFGQDGGWSVPGQPYIWIPMFSSYAAPNRTVNILLRYKIDSGSNLVLDGYTGGSCDSTSINSGTVGAVGYIVIGPGEVTNPVYAAQTIGTSAYFVMETGAPNFFGPSSSQHHLVQIPLTGNSYSDTSGTWDQYITRLPAAGDPYLAATAFYPDNKASIMLDPSGDVRVFVYIRNALGVTLGFGGAACTTTLVDPVNHTATDWQDCSSTFGIPFSDTLQDYSGTPTPANANNDYTAPTIIGTNLYFMRPFDDNLGVARRRMFSVLNEDLDTVLTGDVVDDFYTTVDPILLNQQCFFVQGYEFGGVFYTMGRFLQQYVFGDMGPSPELDCPDEGIVFTFSALNNPEFLDWSLEASAPSSCEVAREPADFESHLWTYYHLQDDTMFWMYSPYTITHLKNEARGPHGTGCLFQPVWEWADTLGIDKFAEQLQIYRVKSPDQTVIDVKNRVRGKGRALQFRYTSESMKDFNILGWGITIDKNTKP